MLNEKELQRLVNDLDKINVELTHVYANSFRDDHELATTALETANQNAKLMKVIYCNYGINPKNIR